MRITPSKGRATGYSDFYKGNSSTAPGGDTKLSRDASTQGASPGSSAFQKRVEDEENQDERKAAIRRRLKKIRAAKGK